MPVLRVSLLKGRSAEQKAKAAAALTEAVKVHLGSRPEDVTVIFDEQAPENWAIAGKPLATN